MQVVLLDNELDQLIGGNKGEDQTGNRQCLLPVLYL